MYVLVFSNKFIQLRNLQKLTKITHNMYTNSILKQLDTNVVTKQSTFFENKLVTNGDLTKIKVQFRGLQIKILNIFTLVKSQLSFSYQQIVNKIKKIQKSLMSTTVKISTSFWNMMEDIESQIQQKINNMSLNLENTIISGFLFDQMMSFITETSTNQPFTSSFKKINGSMLSSGKKLTSKIGNQTIVNLDQITANQYKTAIKIQPNDKRIDNIGCISGKWDVLELINLENKKISRVIPFSTLIADLLLEINLSNNEICHLDFLRQASFPALTTLRLQKNHITSLDGLQDCSFPSLRILNLSSNKLKKLDNLQQINYPQLIQLNLSNNKLQKIDLLTQCNFPKLQILNLDHNIINNIDFILTCTFYRIKILSFCYNQIKSIDCLKKCRLMRLQALIGYNNKIDSINFLSQSDFPQLKQIILNNNCITDIGVIPKMKFEHLRQFDLQNNNIKPQQVMCFVTKSDQSRKAKKKYPFLML